MTPQNCYYVYLLVTTEKTDKEVTKEIFDHLHGKPGITINAMEVYDGKGERCPRK